MDEKTQALAEALRTMEREFKIASKAIDVYVREIDAPVDVDSKYFRLKFMKRICEDLIEILEKNKVLNEDCVGGTEMALALFERVKQSEGGFE